MFYSSLPVFVVGLLIIYLLFFTGCGGIVEIYSSMILAFLLAVYLVLFYIYRLIYYLSEKQKINCRPILFACLLIGIAYSIYYFELDDYLDSYRYEEGAILEAKNDVPYGRMDIRLKEKGDVEFIYGHIEEMCHCSGRYVINEDTLTITKIPERRGFNVSKKYLITSTNFIPINNETLDQDSSKYLKIVRHNSF